jgi:RNase P subunit RPR2
VVDPTDKTVDARGGYGSGEIGELHVEFVIPDAGAFGRPKRVPMTEASAALVTYRLDGIRVEDKQVGVSEAIALVAQAERAMAGQQARDVDLQRRQAQRGEEIRHRLSQLTCLVCGGPYFETRTAREQSEGLGYLTMRLVVCRECGYVMHFLVR